MNATSGREINFFSDCHLAPKFFKVIVHSKIVCRHFQKQTKPFFTLSAFLIDPLKIMLRKRSFTCHKVDTRMDDIQRSSSPKSKMAFSYRSKGTCCVLETNLKRGSLPRICLCKSVKFTISLGKVMMKHSSRQLLRLIFGIWSPK